MIKHLKLSRRRFLQATAGAAATAALHPTPGISAGQRTLRIRSNRDIQVLDPGWMIGGTEIDMQINCLPTLAVFAPGDKLSWRPSDAVEAFTQEDELHYSFRLRPGMTWTNGFGEVTAEDVKYSFERIADPANKAPWKAKWDALKEVQITDKLSGVIVLKEPFAPLIYTTLCNGTGAIVCKKAVQAKGGKFTSEFPAQAGPYLIKQWTPKQYIDLARNPDWKGPAPEFEAIRVVFIEDEKPAEAAFEAGELDLSGISLDSLPRYRKSAPTNSKLFEMPGLWWTWMGMNTEHPKLKDIRVRKAIQLAVDADAVNQAAYAGAAARAHGVVPVGLLGHRARSAFDKPDPAKAKALLAEAGVSDLSLELKTLNQTDRLTAAQVIQANLGEVGIKVEVVPLDSGPFWNLGVEKAGNDWKDLQMWIMRFGDSPDPSQMTQWYTSDQVGVWNWERWKSPEFDELHKKALVERDEEKRAAMYVRMQDIMEDTGAYVWLVFEPVEVIHRGDIRPAMLPGPQIYLPGFKSA